MEVPTALFGVFVSPCLAAADPTTARPGFWATFLSSVFGSDELQSYSAVYSWQANQMAHAMMGFFLAALLYRLVAPQVVTPWKKWLLVLSPFIVPLVKVGPDALVVSAHSTFPVSWAEFFADKATDLSFWYLGMFGGLLLFYPKPAWWGSRAWAVGGTLLVGWLVLAYYLNDRWTTQKQQFDSSGLPPGWVRVSQYPRALLADGGDRPVIDYLNFIRDEQPGKKVHLIIRGGKGADRSGLAVALGTEWASRVKPVRYVTAGRLLEDPSAPAAQKLAALVIDDVITLAPDQIEDEPATPSRYFEAEVKDLKAKVQTRQKMSPRPAAPDVVGGREQRKINTLRSVAAAFNEAEQMVSTVWAVGGADGEADRWEKYIREIFSDDKNEVVVVRLK